MCCSSKHDDDSTSHPSTFEMTMVPREDEDGAVVPSPLQDDNDGATSFPPRQR